ncbi:MAG: amidohydrolase [Rhodobacteraceae bacterium]|nr:MAG: amidohydrolase [Paracoccaceae bacterium]
MLTGLTLAGRDGHWDLAHRDGRITALSPSAQGGGGLVMPLMADIHVHLDKTMTIARMPRRAASLFDAIEMMGEDAARWTEADLRARASRALERAYRHGTAVMRTHLDWPLRAAPLAWPVLRDLAEDWRGRVDLQLSTLTGLDMLDGFAAEIAPEVKRAGGVLGAFIYCNDDLEARVARLFDLAERHDLELDFHVDEGLEPEARGIDAVIAETKRRGMAGRVLCGHGCALSVRDADEVARLLERAAHAGVALCVLPGANSYLQDAQEGRTPRLRGLAPLQEAHAAGIPVMLGSDNVQDGFFPYGDYDLIEVLRMAVMMGHLAPEDWLEAVTTRPAHWLGHDHSLTEGGPASFIHFDATDLTDVICRPGARRTIWRAGQALQDTIGDRR